MRLPDPKFEDREVGHIPKVFHQLADTIEPFRPASGPPPRTLVPFMRWALEGAGTQVWVAVAASVSVGITTVLGFWMIGWLIDSAQSVGPGFLASHGWQLALFVFFYLVIWPASLIANAALNSVTLGPNLYALALSRLQRFTLGQSVSYFDNDFAGRIAQKSQQTARALTDVVLETTNILGNAAAAVLSAAVMLALIDWRMSVAILLWVAAYAALIRYALPRIRVRSQLRAARRAIVTGQIVDTITNVTTVKLFAHGENEEKATEDALGGYREAGIAWAGTVVIFRLGVFVLASLLPTTLIVLALWQWGQGNVTAGDIAAAGLVSTRLATMTGWVSFAALGVFTNIGEIEDGIRTLTPPHQITDARDAKHLDTSKGGVTFENVRFGYGKPGAALDGFVLDLEPGEKVALVGQSGAGKSTVTSLLLRLYDVEEGRILIDGNDLRDLTQDSLRRQIATVRQETAMFNRSARDNILYGRPDATEDELHHAARLAEAHEFILGLEDHRGRQGYDAHLGERGVKLSGGQRQRIALARAVLKDAPILVLDEATSALDSEVEASIQSALETVMEGKTVLAIAHRLSTIARMDRIVVMDAGRIAEIGTHEALLEKGGLYARFWDRQSGGFIGVQEAAE